MRGLKVRGTGAFLQRRVVTAAEIDGLVQAEPGWTQTVTAVRERRYVTDETASFMARKAAEDALSRAELSIGGIDVIIG